ncbi:zinc finger, C2H2 type, putative [Ixodes scapularis]|uniref:Zinc finger, C2H2 type, putative n=1 Tax=Ixodes scapularis TaxID=6945 RepID=B7P7C1_IXOSC|nr:zinc finger, C2H2 type, putative [Ixodes scapularis]|eukprot:XP_002409989.1 zinc finger, C2H2 type, putative [Ixodes scapularis]
MAFKEREAPLFRPWSPKPRAQEPRLVVPEPLYLMPDVFVPSWSWPFHQESVAAAGFEPEAVTRFKSKKQRPKRFQCPHCKVSFSNNGQLKGHVRIHTGERPFACEHDGCGKTFTRNEELTRHKRIHSGLRPFPCPLCQKPFGRKDHLKKHIKTHQRALLPGLPYFFGAPEFLLA